MKDGIFQAEVWMVLFLLSLSTASNDFTQLMSSEIETSTSQNVSNDGSVKLVKVRVLSDGNYQIDDKLFSNSDALFTQLRHQQVSDVHYQWDTISHSRFKQDQKAFSDAGINLRI